MGNFGILTYLLTSRVGPWATSAALPGIFSHPPLTAPAFGAPTSMNTMKTSPSNLPLPALSKADNTAIKAQHQSWSIHALRKSITAGRLLTSEEMMIDPADRGRLNHIPFLNRLNAWWVQMKANGWLKRATREQKETLVRDLNVITRIIQELKK